MFIGDTSPAKVVETLDILRNGTRSKVSMENAGYRNACAVLYRFRLIELTSAGEFRIPEYGTANRLSIESVWAESQQGRFSQRGHQ